MCCSVFLGHCSHILLKSGLLLLLSPSPAFVHYHELRWRIEGCDKAQESGIGVERQCFQSIENLARMAFQAGRLLQLREGMISRKLRPKQLERRCWPKTNGKPCGFRPEPKSLTQNSAARTLGVFCDSKTGRVHRYQAHRACCLGHDLARLVSVTSGF